MELVVLAVLAVGVAVAAVIGFLFLLLKLVFWVVFFPLKLVFSLVFLPIRLLFKLTTLPFGLAFGTVGVGLGLIALPLIILVVGGVLLVGLVVAIVAVMIPAIPFILLGLLLWSVFRKRPAVIRPTG
jgi:hypothetical protein